MIMFMEMDENVILADQLLKGGKDDSRSVILRNKFIVNPIMCVDFWRVGQQTQPYLKQKLGFISTQLHRGISGIYMFVNNAL